MYLFLIVTFLEKKTKKFVLLLAHVVEFIQNIKQKLRIFLFRMINLYSAANKCIKNH